MENDSAQLNETQRSINEQIAGGDTYMVNTALQPIGAPKEEPSVA